MNPTSGILSAILGVAFVTLSLPAWAQNTSCGRGSVGETSPPPIVEEVREVTVRDLRSERRGVRMTRRPIHRFTIHEDSFVQLVGSGESARLSLSGHGVRVESFALINEIPCIIARLSPGEYAVSVGVNLSHYDVAPAVVSVGITVEGATKDEWVEWENLRHADHPRAAFYAEGPIEALPNEGGEIFRLTVAREQSCTLLFTPTRYFLIPKNETQVMLDARAPSRTFVIPAGLRGTMTIRLAASEEVRDPVILAQNGDGVLFLSDDENGTLEPELSIPFRGGERVHVWMGSRLLTDAGDVNAHLSLVLDR